MNFKQFQKNPIESQTKIWVDKGSEFYNRSFKVWIKENDIEIYSTHNEKKSVVAEIFTRSLKNKKYKYMTSISTNVHINNLNNRIVEYHSLFMLSRIHILEVRNKDKDKKFKVGDHV